MLRREGSQRQAGGQPGHQGAGRELAPEDQIDEIVDHYPRACRGCGRQFTIAEQASDHRFGRHQVAELPPINVLLVEHRTHRLRCSECQARTTAMITPHSLRRTWATLAAMVAGDPRWIAAQISGRAAKPDDVRFAFARSNDASALLVSRG